MAYGTQDIACRLHQPIPRWRHESIRQAQSLVTMTESDGNRPARTRPIRLGRWPSELIQFAPLIVFVNMRRLGFDHEERFLAGAGAAVIVVALLIALRVRMNPLLVGVQTWLVIEAFAFVVHFPLLADVLIALRESSFFLVIIVVAGVYLSQSKSLLSVDDVEPEAARRASLALLALAGLAFLVSLPLRGD